MLDEFSKKTTQPTTTSAPAKPAPAQNDEDFAKTLESSMQNLIGELDSNPDMQKEFEKMMQELIAAGSAPTDDEAAKHISSAAEAVGGKTDQANKDTFQETIRKTMERMQASGDQATAAASASNEDDFLAQMLKDLSAAGGGGEEDFNKMLMGMMAQLTHKEILYEPMKELHDKFPAWIEKNQKDPDLARFKEQQKLVGDIVSRFEKKGYSDDNNDDREYIVDKMQKVCTELD